MIPPTFIHVLNYVHTPFYRQQRLLWGCIHRDINLRVIQYAPAPI